MITVIIPSFNSEQFITRTIESVLTQTRAADEVLIVDDCSTDKSLDIAKRYPVRILQTVANSGHATARNLGLRSANGDLIAWLDADDYWEPQHLETVSALLEVHPQAAVAFSAVQKFGEQVGVLGNFPCSGSPRRVFWESLRGCIVPHMSAVVRKNALSEVGGYDESFKVAPDFDLWLRLSRTYGFVSTEKITANYRQHRSQISQDRRGQMVSVYRARQKLRDEVRRQGDTKLAAEIEQVMVEIWEDALRQSWKRRNLEHLRFLLSLKSYLPRGSRVGVKLSILSSLRTTRDRLRQAWLGRGSANPTIDEAAAAERSESLIP
jgi:glycosyltransferase involved in cell wall biosynthesis